MTTPKNRRIMHLNGTLDLDGKICRKDDSVIEYSDGTKCWYQNDESGELRYIEYDDGQKAWYCHGLLHREDGPAVEFPDGTKKWYCRGTLHRIDGPAVEQSSGAKEWWINGERVDPLTHTMMVNEYLQEDEK